MSSPWDWPGLQLPPADSSTADPGLPPLEAERAVWGKAHGQASDFRWLGRSPGFPETPELRLALGIGSEDRPRRSVYWRASGGGRFLAIAAYPSRAVDAAGRSGFLERQILAWSSGDLPPALGAILWLPRSQAFEGEGAAGEVLRRCAAPSPLEAPGDLSEAISQGLEELQQAACRDALIRLYGELLSRDPQRAIDGPSPGAERPCWLTVEEPLTPLALAALLLPLPRDLGGRLSLAGWVPSSRVALPELEGRWSLVCGAPSLAPRDPGSPGDSSRASRPKPGRKARGLPDQRRSGHLPGEAEAFEKVYPAALAILGRASSGRASPGPISFQSRNSRPRPGAAPDRAFAAGSLGLRPGSTAAVAEPRGARRPELLLRCAGGLEP